MKNLIRSGVAVAALFGLAACAAAQQLPGPHPYYLHALTDLRTARWFLYHQQGDVRVYAGEDEGIRQIDAAINEIKQASIDDGKNLEDHPNVDVHEHGSRLLKAIETLKKARQDVDQPESDPVARGLKHRVQDHIDHAIAAADMAHQAWLQDVHH